MAPDKEKTDTPPPALIQLLSPDGYYTYLGIEKPVVATGDSDAPPQDGALHQPLLPAIDEEAVKKNYRKLSLKHHPDKPQGDVETFRTLNRAQKVLLNPKARQQYDILGIDLDDDEEHEQHDENEEEKPSTAQGIVHEIASAALTSIMQLAVRTLMMAAVSVILVRYRWTLYPALAFLIFISYQLVAGGGGARDVMSPALIGVGLLCMHRASQEDPFVWTKLYGIGEALVIHMFIQNSMSAWPRTPLLTGVIAVVSLLCALWFRGNLWNYLLVLGLEAFVLVFVTLAFPVMEMVLEAILNEKLKKVGDKVRAHHVIMEKYYEQKLKQ